jgi:LPXTG-motif cell wall-anchored protein
LGDNSWGTIRRMFAVGALVLVGQVAVTAQVAGALTGDECADVVAEGTQARGDLAKLIESTQGGSAGGVTTTTSPETASYVAALLSSASINQFGFVSADAGAPLELCVPAGTTKLTLFSDPVVVWEGAATTDAYPVTVTIPLGLECGTHRLQATGPAVDQSVEFTVAGSCTSVQGAVIVRNGLGLPRTGAEIGTTLAVGIGILAAGLAALRARRARLSALGRRA